MQHPATPPRTIAPAARIRQRGTFFKAQDLNTRLYLRLDCSGRRPPRLTDSRLCTWFTSRDQAVQCLAAFGPAAIEIERHDA